MKKIVFLLILILFGTTAFSESAGEVLQAKLNGIRSLTANFTQTVKAKARELSRSSGTMALERPGRFRWQTKDPMEQLVVADGDQLWVYDVDLEQVTVKRQEKGVGGTAALFLSGYDDTVTRDFDVTATTKGKMQIYDLQSKSKKANFQRVKLIFAGATLNGMEMFDQLGQHTIVSLKNVKTNPRLSAVLFKFKPPKGVDVVKQ
ncbi:MULTISPECIES: outer membrane lipoprotein chaperone LolA [unclassified Legionella]|uniref:outer membrane lipoprotein chaperone LolA n=1 Tax=unclassified Legionella TaxID=2622702 RepID=UPI00105421C5|nr:MULTISPECIES: outer membrane lipoprotein chaperone LolA [unclassified Legionella]MDI9817650.1 outer membrane lipoprotein chaperone LolA [Legionella sp. PL877]